jgi:spermidine synthase
MRARAGLVFGYGFFCIGIQTLLFREYLGALAGNDLGIGLFFTCWFLWAALGARLTHRWPRCFVWSVAHAELLPLVYLPAVVIEWLLFLNLQRWTGVESYRVLSLAPMLGWSLAVTWPVSFLTGWLFPVLSTRWAEKRSGGIGAVYVLEAAGSLGGGVVVTVALANTWSQEASLLLLVLVLILGAGVAYADQATARRGRVRLFLALVTLGGVGLLVTGADQFLTDQLQRYKWQRLLPAEGWEGGFHTAQAEYLHGIYQDQWVVMSEGSVVEALPDSGREGALVALVMAQNPGAQQVLVVGPSLGLCQGFLKMAPVQQVDWFTPDRDYANQVLNTVPAAHCHNPERLRVVTCDVRQHLQKQTHGYDLVVVNLAYQLGSATHRYYTEEFFQGVQEALKDGGLLLVTVPGDDLTLGPELATLGASVRQTLRRVFAEVLLVPGARTVFMATDMHYLDDEPGPLRDRFAAIAGSHSVYAADGLLSLYRPERAQEVNTAYDRVRLSPAQLINRDNQPRFYLYSLLWAARRSGLSLTGWAETLNYLGVWLAVLPIGAGLLVYGFYVFGHRPRRSLPDAVVTGSGFTTRILVGLSGAVSIGFVVTLMTRYETLFGSLYLYVGLISSAFMAGLTGGALLAHHYLKNRDPGSLRVRLLILTALLIPTAALAVLSVSERWPTIHIGLQRPLGLMMALGSVGLCLGTYVPWAAVLLQRQGRDTETVAGMLASADHLGAAAGGLLCSLVLIPFLGLTTTLQCLAVMLGANILWEGLRPCRMEKAVPLRQPVLRRRRWGYALFAIALAIVAGRHVVTWTRTTVQATQNELPITLSAWTEGRTVQVRSAVLVTGPEWFYHVLSEKGKLTGYIVQTERLAPRVYGFGGPIHMALLIDPEGELQDFRLLRHYETPGYIWSLDRWFGRLIGKTLWGENTLQQVHAVSGATYTSQAVIEILQHSGQAFAHAVLGQAPEQNEAVSRRTSSLSTDTGGWLLITLALLSLLVSARGGLSLRLILLGVTVMTCGFWLNMQFSTEQLVALLSGRLPQAGLTGRFVLVLGIPVLLLFFGNLYCGYLCPFGALQELLGFLWPRRWKLEPTRETLQRLRFVKVVVLFLVVLLYFAWDQRSLMAGDPLVWFFKKNALQEVRTAFAAARIGPRMAVLGAGLAVLAGVLLSTRFWCRTLCPTGAFLSLSNRVTLLRRWRPDYKYGRCEFGLTGRDHQDCLACDRCRFGPDNAAVPLPEGKTRPQASGQGRVLTGLVLLVLALWLAPTLRPLFQPVTTRVARSLQRTGANGQPRTVDMARLGELIRTKRLSDQEARFYRIVAEAEDPNESIPEAPESE